MMFFRQIDFFLDKKDKVYIAFLVLFSLIVAVVEAVGISAIMPFVEVAMNTSQIEETSIFGILNQYFEFDSNIDFVVFFAIALVTFYLVRAPLNLLYFYQLAKYSNQLHHRISCRLFERYLLMSYSEFTKANGSYMTKTLVNETANLTELFSSMLLALSEVLIFVMLIGVLLWVDWRVTTVLLVGISILALIIYLTVTRLIRKLGKDKTNAQNILYKVISSAFGNFKVIRLIGSGRQILKDFRKASYGYTYAKMMSSSLGHYPRVIMESVILIISVISISFLASQNSEDSAAIFPIVILYIATLYRLMPSVNRFFALLNKITFQLQSIKIVSGEILNLKISKLEGRPISFNQNINLQNVSYFNRRKVFDHFNLKIEKGDWAGIVGESGSGKSTLSDIIMGLVVPDSGLVEVDGKRLTDDNVASWMGKIGYIPQNVYLLDGTVEENVVMGRARNKNRVIETLRIANIWDELSKGDGLETKVGDSGIQLSGGQKQRVAIARALYGNPEILILDEATSALDSKTEKKIMDEIYKLSKEKTLIIITHKPSLTDQCHFVISI